MIRRRQQLWTRKLSQTSCDLLVRGEESEGNRAMTVRCDGCGGLNQLGVDSRGTVRFYRTHRRQLLEHALTVDVWIYTKLPYI